MFNGLLDYVLPGKGLKIRDTGIYWPTPESPQHHLVSEPDPSSDHRLVWVDVVATETH